MRYAAFFRGVNVGGKNKVLMAELKELFSDCGFSDVRTYIQSGNVLFATEKEEAATINVISAAFEKRFGFHSDVILRSHEELTAVLSALPFTQEEIREAEAAMPEVEHVYIYFSQNAIDAEAITALCDEYAGEDRLRAATRELYLLCRQSIRDSKLAAPVTKLGVPLTCRNQKTLQKIRNMFEA
jgi:uncharacterized protein (DUF1697 family)